ncbi:response regulator transcription factor [uncultured Dokdonia sp.]|uniref:helix-turn-helix domain-containing protein n=1 Tax=uncultured Dokdonia sp. TaxID=575653 RepID=UPI0026324E2C|nr:response regulator transcription factor [uncultured Dokdonia sp.]
MKKKLQIRDLKVSDVVIDMAKTLGVDYDEEHCETCLELPEHLGSGYVKAYEFDFGFGIIETDYTLKKDFHFDLKKGALYPLKILFNRGGSFYHCFEEDGKETEIKTSESLIVAGTASNNHVFKFKAGVPTCIFSLEINRKLFEEKIESFLPNMDEELITLFRDVNGINNFFHKSRFNDTISKFLEEFTECDLDGFMKQVYQEGKSYEIFTHILKQYLDDQKNLDKRVIMRKSTVESIEKARAIIKDQIAIPINVSSLAKKVGVNQNTLQNGFRNLYDVSVNEYIRNHRIDTAKQLLTDTDLNITEVTYKVGINSRSYFSKLFKNKFGVSPNEYLKKVRSKSTG